MKLFFSLIIIFLFPPVSFAQEQMECDFNFKVFEDELLRQIPKSVILYHDSNGREGEILLEVAGIRNFMVAYNACFHLVVQIRADHIDPEYIKKTLDLSQPIILQSVGSMSDIFKSLKPHMADSILSFNIRDNAFSKITFETTHHEDGTISIEISSSGG